MSFREINDSTGRGLSAIDIQTPSAASDLSEVGVQVPSATQSTSDPDFPSASGSIERPGARVGLDAGCERSGGDGQHPPAAQTDSAIDPTLIGDIREFWRQRQDLHRAEKSLTLQIKAKCRRAMEGDKTEGAAMYKSMLNGQKMEGAFEVRLACDPFINARAMINAERMATEKQLTKMVKQLPVYPWVESVRGFGALLLAGIVGEAGDLSNYPNPAKLWKRMGLAVINGERQRRVTGADALEHGYNPQRRCLVWNLGACLIKAQPKQVIDEETGEILQEAGEYRVVYDERRSRTSETHPDWSDAHANNDAKRVMEKRLLRNLWRAWRDA